MSNSATKYIFYDSEIEAMKRDITISKRNINFPKKINIFHDSEIEARKKGVRIFKKFPQEK